MPIMNGGYREFVLDNGLRVALQQTPTETVAGRLRVRHGSLNEQEGEEGIAHFLEHMLSLGGTQRYSPEELDALASLLPDFNAGTSLDQTDFPVSMMGDDLELYLNVVTEMAFSPRMDAARLDEERVRIRREIADDNSDPAERCSRLYRNALSGNGPQSRTPLGKESVVRRATAADMMRFHGRGYYANNMDLILAGCLPADAECLIRRYLGERPVGPAGRFAFPRVYPPGQNTFFHLSAPEFRSGNDSERISAELTMGVIVGPEGSPDEIPSLMLTAVLCDGFPSRIFGSVCQRRGMAYSINGAYEGSCNMGVLEITGMVHPEKFDAAADALLHEFRRLRERRLDDAELDRYKKIAAHDVARGYEDNDGHVEAIELYFDHGVRPDEYIAGIMALTPDALLEAANRYLPRNRSDPNYVLMVRDPLKE